MTRLRRTALPACLLAAAALLAACKRDRKVEVTGGPPTGTPAPNAPKAPNGPNAPNGGTSPDDTIHNVAGQPPILPDTARTPGATLPVTAKDICVPGYSKKVRNVPSAVKKQVYASYGITQRAPGEYEVDHLISLELGGSNSVRNLWPESFRTQPWNAHVKDALENELHRRVCAGTLDLAAAQRAIAGNWIAAYHKYVGPTPSPR